MEMNTKTISLLGVGVIALVVIAMAMAGMVAGYFTNPADPIQAQVELAQEQGPQGAFEVKIYICSPTSPVRPVGGAYRLVDGTIDSQPLGWMREGSLLPCAGTGDVLWFSSSNVNPAMARDEAGSLPLQWTPPVEFWFGRDDFATVVARVATLEGYHTETIYYWLADRGDASTIDVSTLTSLEANVAGQEITVGPDTSGQYVIILVPTAHDLVDIVDVSTDSSSLSSFTRTADVRELDGEQYTIYTLGPSGGGVTYNYRLELTE